MSAVGDENAAEAGDNAGKHERTVIPPASENEAVVADGAAGAKAEAAECLQGCFLVQSRILSYTNLVIAKI